MQVDIYTGAMQPGQKCVFLFSLRIVCLPERVEDESSQEKANTEHHKQAITQPLVLGIVGQLGSLWEKEIIWFRNLKAQPELVESVSVFELVEAYLV